MRFMMIVKHAEKQGPPPKPLMDAIAKLAEEDSKKGKMLGSGGLGPTALGARVRLSGGQVTVTDGPFTEAKEVVGGYAQFESWHRNKKRSKARYDSWNCTRNTGRVGKAKPKFVRCSDRKTCLTSDSTRAPPSFA